MKRDPTHRATFGSLTVPAVRATPRAIFALKDSGTPMPAPLKTMADAIRVLSMDAVERANSGHPGMPMGMADVATVLWSKHMKYDAGATDWADRDRFILSAGHGSMLLYSLLHLAGVKAVSMEEIKNFRVLGSKTPGHPEYGHTPGVETTTGPLGQGIATAVGFAMAERHMAARFGADLVDHRTWVVAGDGCLMEGVSQEAIALAGRLKLNKLTVMWDNNAITIDGAVSLSDATDQLARFKASGWAVKAIDGHDYGEINRALTWARRQDKPTLIACRTKIGKGAATLEGHHDTHGKALGKDEVKATREKLGWTAEPFVVPDEVYKPWRAAGRRGRKDMEAWAARLDASPSKAEFLRAMSGDLPVHAFDRLEAFIADAEAKGPAAATRQHSGAVLDQIFGDIADLVGGSADLTGSNNTFVKNTAIFDDPDYAGRYVNYGIREHGMAAAMNGMALHGGVIPYGGTFLVFTDYMRPAIRLAALMGVRVIHVGTHDSIGLGEDGPTHQPVEHLAALRAMPNLYVFRPADAVETAECWRLALETKTTPSVMALSRQKAPAVRTTVAGENLSARGAYQLAAAGHPAQVTIFATGTEVGVAMAARDLLEADGVGARVVSVPSHELFAAQPSDYQAQVIGDTDVRVAVEAGVRMGWDRFIDADGVFIGMSGFGASGPAEQLYKHFGITAEAVAAAAKAKLP
jgi:transketolase